MPEQSLERSLFNQLATAVLVYGEGGFLRQANQRGEELLVELGRKGTSERYGDHCSLLGSSLLQTGESRHSQEVTTNGRNLLIRQARLTTNGEEALAVFVDDVTPFRAQIGSLHQRTIDALWKIRSRTTGIQNALSLLVEYAPETLDPDTLGLLRDARYETWQLSRYTNNLRDLSLVGSQLVTLDMEECRIDALLDDVIEDVMVYADYSGKECRIEKTIAPDASVRADRVRLEHILSAVLLNSVVYSGERPAIAIGAERSGGQVELTVRDNGTGMDEDEQGAVFDYGFRGRGAQDGACGGMGIELYLARHMLIRMNGSISLQSARNRGTTVTITLAGWDDTAASAPKEQPWVTQHQSQQPTNSPD